MAKKNYNIIHKRSSISGRTPAATALTYGEIAVNYAANNEKLFVKNSSNTIAIFPEQSWVSTQVSNAIASAATSANTLNEIIKENEEVIAVAIERLTTKVTELVSTVDENEEVTTAALTDLDTRIINITNSANTLNTKIDTEVGNAIASAATSANTLNTAINTLSGNTHTAITNEATARASADDTLTAAYTQLEIRVRNLESALQALQS